MTSLLAPPANGGAPVFVLLDDALAGHGRLYTDWVAEHRCCDAHNQAALWAAVAADQAKGWHAVVLADYEWGLGLHGLRSRHASTHEPAALRVLMFACLARLDAAAIDTWLCHQEAQSGPGAGCGPAGLRRSTDPGPLALLGLKPDWAEAPFSEAVAAIQAAIARGETYQVNLTDRWHGQFMGSPVALYRRLRRRQPVAFGALLALPAPHVDAQPWVLSCSPELFLHHSGGVLTAQPMKGTAARGTDAAGDAARAHALRTDPKNRAENLMIVDLLRNDLGQLARVGGVRVPALFEVTPLATLQQMTSTVTAELRADVDLAAIWRACFPCGSITGAPKRQTLGWIDRLESAPRGLYCGAIGWLDAPLPAAGSVAQLRVGDFCFSVPIRTLNLGPLDADTGTRALELGVGAGVVADSRAADEWQECQLKARFLTDLAPGFELFETLRAVCDRAVAGMPAAVLPLRVLNLAAHVARLAGSAHTLGFVFDQAAAERALATLTVSASEAAADPACSAWRVRLDLAADGRLRVQLAPLRTADPPSAGLRLFVSPLRRPLAHPLSAHKTTLRADYDAAIAQAEAAGGFDCLFFNSAGRLAEGGRCNVFVRLPEGWFTPPVADGALPGVARAQVLQQGIEGQPVRERSLSEADVRWAQAVCISNALRGRLPAHVVWAPPTVC